MEFTRLTKKYVAVDVTATSWEGLPETLTGVQAAITDRAATPTALTTWTDCLWNDPTARVLVAGPDADPSGALVLADDGGRLWLRIVDTPEVDLYSAAVIRVV